MTKLSYSTLDSPFKILSYGYLSKKYTSITWEKIHMVEF